MSGMALKEDLSVRLSVAETKVANMNEDIAEQKTVLKDIVGKVDGLKERFDKMNGSIPHIKDSCNRIEKHLELIAKSNNQHETEIVENKTKIAHNALYIKLLWGLVSANILAITGAMIKIIFFG